MSRSKPLVSVIMPVYNAADYLSQAIDSILGQTYKDFELLIVDDGSSDQSYVTAQKYQKKYPNKVKLFKTKTRMNAAGNGAVNSVLRFAHGKFIARMDADDIAHKDRLKKQVQFLHHHPDTLLVGTQARVINRQGALIGKKTYPTSHEHIYKKYAIIHPIVHPSCMIRRSLLPHKNKIYEMKAGINDDYYTFFKLLNFGKFANIDEYLHDYRLHGKNNSLQNVKYRFKVSAKIRKQAVAQFGYKMTWQDRFILWIQSMIINVLPEEMIISLYFQDFKALAKILKITIEHTIRRRFQFA